MAVEAAFAGAPARGSVVSPSEHLAAGLLSAREGIVGWRRAAPVAAVDFLRSAGCWQAAFAAHPGRRFGLYFKDTIEFAAALFGLWHSGKQAWLPADMTQASQNGLRAVLDGFAGDVPPPVGVSALSPATEPSPVHEALDVEAQQLVVYTSGSTGQPQALPKRLRQLFDEVTALDQAFGSGLEGAVVLGSVSHQHVYGLLFRVLWPLATHRTIQAHSLVVWEDLAELIPMTKRVVVVASPAHLSRLPSINGTSVARVFSSGAPLPDAAVPDCLHAFGQAPIEVYGSSETGGVAWRQRNPGAASHWLALPGVGWKIEDGTLWLRSPHLEASGWLPSADRAAAVADGFELRGRTDRVVKIAGKRVSLSAVEATLRESPWLVDLRLLLLGEPREQIAVVAVPTAAGWALLEHQGKRALTEALREALGRVVERVALPRRFRFVAELPVNTQGKSTQVRLLAEFDPRRPVLREVRRTEQGQDLTLLIDPRLPQFEGHFSGHPILAGVVQLEWAELFGRERFDNTAPFSGMDAIKFQRVITADQQRVTLSLAWAPGTLSFRYHSQHGLHASGRLRFQSP